MRSWAHPARISSAKDTAWPCQLWACRWDHPCTLLQAHRPTNPPTGRCGCWRPSKSQGGDGPWEPLTCMMLLRRGWRLLRYSFFTSISLRIFSLLDRHSRYFSASLLREDRALSWDAPPGTPQHTCSLPDSTQWQQSWWTANDYLAFTMCQALWRTLHNHYGI